LGMMSLLVALLGATGCATSDGPTAGAPQTFTESDEPESRKRATNRLNLAVLYFQDGKLNFALDEVKQAILADPNWYQAYWMRGLIQMQTNDLAAAEGSFQKALSINANTPDVKHNYGVLLCKMKRPVEAMRMFSSALADPAYGARAKTWQEQGVCQLSLGQKVEAETSFLRSFELDAGSAVTAYNLASLLWQRGEAARAQFYARRVNNGERASAESLWLGIKIERSLGSRDAQSQLETQLTRRFAQSREALALERGAFNE
jgi:type IV pilus assembly protein PilF